MKIYRHGDLLIREVDNIPTKAKKVSSGKLNKLALGEVTGHSHKLETIQVVDVFELDGVKYFNTPVEAILSHEEHNTLKLAPSTYTVLTEREYDYFLEEQRKVLD